jgi:glycosyltransferase involved in cell wall biosynthesis
MNCFNGARYLKEAVDTVIAQTYDNWEIILWDNRSTDSSKAIIDSYHNPKIKYFYADEFTTLGEARNRAIKKASGELIAFLDVDDIWFPQKLEKQVALFKDPQVGIVVSDTIFFNEQGDFKQIYKTNKPPRGDVFRELMSGYFISLETVVVRRSFLDHMNAWFDPRFNMIEEMDFLLRLSKISKFDYVDEPLAKWRMHNQSWTFEKRHRFPVERRQMIETYRSLYPDFDKNYGDSIHAILKMADFEESLVLFQQKKTPEARKVIQPHAFKDKKYFVFYTLMFFPRNILLSLLKKRGIIC